MLACSPCEDAPLSSISNADDPLARFDFAKPCCSKFDCGRNHVDILASRPPRASYWRNTVIVLLLSLAVTTAKATAKATAKSTDEIAFGPRSSLSLTLTFMTTVATLLAIAVTRALLIKPPAPPPADGDGSVALKACLAEAQQYAVRLSLALQCQTISYDPPSDGEPDPTDFSQFTKLHSLLEKWYTALGSHRPPQPHGAQAHTPPTTPWLPAPIAH
jgi:hypothetical protein